MSSRNRNVSLRTCELSFHIFKRFAGASPVPLYTIGVWEGRVQRAICHDACLTCALTAIRRELERPDHSADRPPASNANDPEKPAWYVEYATTVRALSEEEALHLGEHDVARGSCIAKAIRS
jgi:hypothetical protein